MPVDLQRLREHAAGATKREIVTALREHGFAIKRNGAKHEIWSNGTFTVMVPRTLKGAGTKRQIIDQIIASSRVASSQSGRGTP